MLLKSFLLFATAVLATVSSSSQTPTADISTSSLVSTKGLPACPECLPCRTDCACAEDHKSNCTVKAIFPTQDPLGRPVCGKNEPCTSACVCPPAIQPRKPDDANGIVCCEGCDCTKDCSCSFATMLKFVNPGDLPATTLICPEDKCNSGCICRETLLASVKDLLYPAKQAKVVDFKPEDSAAVEKDEL